MQQSERKPSRTRSPRGKSPSGRMSRCKDHLKGTCTIICISRHEAAEVYSPEEPPFCENGILQNACSTSPKKDADLGKSARMHIARSKRYKKNGDKSAVALLMITRQLGCIFHDMEPPKSSSILRKSSNILKPIQCVRFTEAVLRHANIRDQNPSLGMICPSDPHQRNQCSKF